MHVYNDRVDFETRRSGQVISNQGGSIDQALLWMIVL